MSVVLHGLGITEIDTGSTLVAFGLVNDPAEGVPIETAIANSGIDQLFVIDYGSQTRRKPTAAEFRKYKRIVKLMQSGQVQFEAKTRNGKKGIEFTAVRKPSFKKAA